MRVTQWTSFCGKHTVVDKDNKHQFSCRRFVTRMNHVHTVTSEQTLHSLFTNVLPDRASDKVLLLFHIFSPHRFCCRCCLCIRCIPWIACFQCESRHTLTHTSTHAPTHATENARLLWPNCFGSHTTTTTTSDILVVNQTQTHAVNEWCVWRKRQFYACERWICNYFFYLFNYDFWFQHQFDFSPHFS